MKKLTKILTTTGAAGLLMFGMAPSALAGSDAHAYVYSGSVEAADANFISNGDNFVVCDDYKDGYSAVLSGIRPDGNSFVRWQNSGAGTCTIFYFDFTEGKTIPFQVCLGVSATGAIVKCGATVYGVA